MSSVIYRRSFPALPELKDSIANSRASGTGWPTVVIETRTQPTERLKIDGPLSLFMVDQGTAEISCGSFSGHARPLTAVLTHGQEPYSLIYEHTAVVRNIHFADDLVHDVIGRSFDCQEVVVDPNRRAVINRAVRALSTGLLMQQQESTLLLLANVLSWYHGMPAEIVLPTGRNTAERHNVMRRLMRCRELLHFSTCERVTLDDLASVACMSKYHFLRSFKLAFGCTPSAYHQHARMVAATHLIRSTEDPITVIAERVGYDSVGTFAATYRRVMGVTPGAVRLQQRAITKNVFVVSSK